MTAPEDTTGSIIEVANIEATASADASTMTAPEDATGSTIEAANIEATATPAATPPEVAAAVPAPPAIADPAGDSIPARPTIVTATMPPQLLPGSYALPSLLAHIASDKFCDGLPLHRQEDRFARLGATYACDDGACPNTMHARGLSSMVEDDGNKTLLQFYVYLSQAIAVTRVAHMSSWHHLGRAAPVKADIHFSTVDDPPPWFLHSAHFACL
jgi:hypothetical protein